MIINGLQRYDFFLKYKLFFAFFLPFSYTFHEQYVAIQYNFNPIEKIITLYDEKIKLYVRRSVKLHLTKTYSINQGALYPLGLSLTSGVTGIKSIGICSIFPFRMAYNKD